MLTFGVLFFGVGLVLIIFNVVDFSFVKDQQKDKRQIIAGAVFLVLSLIMLFVSIKNIILGEG